MTYLAVPISGDTVADAKAAIDAAAAGGANLVELRLDLLPPDSVAELVAHATIPVLATCRDAAEGGGRDADDLARAEMLVAACDAGAHFVDFELAAFARSEPARRLLAECLDSEVARKLILSAHDFSAVPDDLPGLFRKLADSPADVLKVAYKAARVDDCFAALDAVREAPRSAVALAMGEAGVLTRLLARKLGAFCTFAALGEGQGTAPGQPTLNQFKRLYRWNAVGADTQLFGVIGCPVAHSMSPAIHNTAFGEADVDGLYVPLLVEPGYEAFAALVDGIRERNDWLNFRGLSVTLPHKENALRYVTEASGRVDELSRRIGAINTITFEPDGRLAGQNTDYDAALDAICCGLGIARSGLNGRRVAVIGAGGVARALVAGLADAGAEVKIFNRTADRALALAGEFDCRAAPLDKLPGTKAKIIVNCTSVGMHPNEDASPMPAEALAEGQLVFDTVYNPVRTKLLADAEAAGARTVDGVEMFVRQAVAQFERWTGVDAPRESMRQVVLDRLTS